MPSPFHRTTRSLERAASRSVFVFWAAGGAFLAAWLAWFFLGRVNVYEVADQARLEVAQTAHAVSPVLSGRVIASTLEIGREVKVGDVLVELDASTAALRLREETTRLAALSPRIASLHREIAELEKASADDTRSAAAATDSARYRVAEASAAVAFARDNERRLRQESGTGSVPQVEALRAVAESTKLAATRDALASEMRRIESDARNRTHQNQAQIESLRSTIVALEGETSATQATIARLESEIEKHRIKAPVAGRIGEMTPVRPGTFVSEGQKLASIVPFGDVIVVADFRPAAALGRVLPGQQARLRLDGFPWAQYGSLTATVKRVSGEIRGNAVRVELVPTTPTSRSLPIQHGLPGSVEIIVETTSPAVLLLRATGQLLSRPPVSVAVAPGSKS